MRLFGKFAIFYLAGVVAAAQLGKMAALAPAIGAEIPLGLVVAAALVSLLEIGGALFGRIAGGAAQRIGQARVLPAGMALLAVAGLGGSFAGSAETLVVWRLVEAAGYLGVIVSAPVLIAGAVEPHERGAALAFWSSFVPVGLMLGAALSGALADGPGWRAAMLLWGAASALALLALVLRERRAAAIEASGATRPASLAIWLLTLGFGFYAAFQVGMLTLLPALLVEQAGVSTRSAGAVTGAASFLTILGIAVAARWVRRGGPAGLLAALGSLPPAALLFLVFGEAPDFATAAVAAILLNAISGLFCGLVFAMLPALSGRDGLPAANGLLAQFGASGSLLGPPLYAACVEGFGWTAAAICGAVGCMIALGLFLAATRRL